MRDAIGQEIHVGNRVVHLSKYGMGSPWFVVGYKKMVQCVRPIAGLGQQYTKNFNADKLVVIDPILFFAEVNKSDNMVQENLKNIMEYVANKRYTND